MKQHNLLVIGLFVFLIIFGGIFFLYKEQKGSSTMKQDEIMMEKKEQKMQSGYMGNVLAGNTSLYIEFNKADYEKALQEGKIVFLDFFANWCPICRVEAPELKAGFDSLTTEKVVGFRVNYNDTETDEDEKKLAEEFDIPYQHTKVILKDRKEVLKDGDTWDKEKFLEEINKVL
ncbi:redoxin domain-containing protein [Candidatus Roizmanbacteria bacterium]|nr:redoxin domain-containing protein [Candidatus Roizmanbacteria bacterium]